MGNANQLAPPVAFFHLAIDQALRHQPLASMPSLAISLEPVSKMGGESIEIQIEAITGKEWNAARSQEFSQGMDEAMGHVLCSGTQMQDRKNLRAGVDGEPQPEHVLRAAQPGSQFIQLEMWELQMAEGPLVQGQCMFPSASQKGA
jgi:hypothetical protein